MSDLLNQLMGQLGGDRLGQVAGDIGADSGATQKAISSALPALLGALSNNASKPEGAAALRTALDDHDGSVLDDPSDLLTGGGSGEGILSHVLGAKRSGVEQAVSDSSGLDLGSVTKLLPMLAPMLMGALGKKSKEGGMDAGALAGFLGGERASAESSRPGLGGLAKLIDRDGDGDFMDDVKEMAGGLTGDKSAGGKGGLGGLFSKLFKR